MSSSQQFQFTGEVEQLAKLRRAKLFSWNIQKKQTVHNHYQQYFASHLVFNGRSFAWDTNKSTALLKPPARYCIAMLLWLAVSFVLASYEEQLIQLGVLLPIQLACWMLLVYPLLGIGIHRLSQIINPLSYAGMAFRFTGTAAGFFREVVVIPCLLFTGALLVVRYLDVPAVYRLGLADVLFFFILAISNYLFDKFRVTNTSYAGSLFLFNAKISDYLKLHLKIFLLFLLNAEFVLIYIYSIDTFNTFNVAPLTVVLGVGFSVLLICGFVYSAITIKIEHRTLLLNHVAINGKRLNSSMQTSEFFQQLYLVVKRFITSAGKQKLALTQHFLLYQLTNLSLVGNASSKTSVIV